MPTERRWTQAELEAEAAAFDWSGVRAKSDKEIEAAARADPDSYLATDEELRAAVLGRTERLKVGKRDADPPQEAAE